jgi:hypothetical protein
VTTKKRPKAITLPCLFATLTEIYSSSSQLALCETKQKQRWRHASGEVVLERIGHFAKYFPELVSLSESLENYSFCERHYNQIIATNHLLEHLKTLDIPIVNVNQRKRPRHIIDNSASQPLTIDNNTPTLMGNQDKQAVSEIGIQVSYHIQI